MKSHIQKSEDFDEEPDDEESPLLIIKMNVSAQTSYCSTFSVHQSSFVKQFHLNRKDAVDLFRYISVKYCLFLFKSHFLFASWAI